jgi:hypothetical protein
MKPDEGLSGKKYTMKTKPGIYLLILGSMLLSACGAAPTAQVPPVVEQPSASPTPTLAAGASPEPTLTALPSATSDPAQILLEKRQQDILTYLSEPIDAAIAANGGDWFILLQELGGETLVARQADTPVWVDNLIHLPITVLFLRSIEDTGVTEMKVYLTVNRDYETSLRQTLFEMLVYGNETSAANVLGSIPRYGLNINQTLQAWNMADTSIPYKLSSPENLVSLLAGLANRSLLSDESTVLTFDMLDQGDKGSNPLYLHAPQGAIIHDKQVSVSTQDAMIGELAVVEVGDSTYLLAIFGFTSDKLPVPYVELAQAYASMVEAFWGYVEVR